MAADSTFMVLDVDQFNQLIEKLDSSNALLLRLNSQADYIATYFYILLVVAGALLMLILLYSILKKFI